MLLIALALIAGPQQSPARFDAAVSVLDPLQRMEFLTDFDLDGETDLISFYRSNVLNRHHDLAGFAGDGTGGFAESWRLSIPWDSNFSTGWGIGMGDLDGDGRDDFVGSIGDNLFAARFVGPGAAPSITQLDPQIHAATRIELTDVTGDGYADAVLVTDSGELKVYLNRGPAQDHRLTFQSRLVLPGFVYAMAVGDLTGDGISDVAVGSVDGVRIWPIDATGQLQAPQFFSVPQLTFYAGLAIGDVDGDGDDDLVAFERPGTTGAAYTLFRRTGPGVLVQEAPVMGGPATALADVDGDGDLDGVCCGGGIPSPPRVNRANSKFEIAINDGSGAFAPAFQIQGLGSHHIAGVEDIDHDGDMDLLGGRAIYYARGPLTGDPYRRTSERELWPSTLVDFDGDGDRDAGVELSGMERSRGDGSYARVALDLPAAPGGLTYVGPGYPGDWNGDGTIDLIVKSENTGGFVAMRLLENRGGGHLVDAGPAGAPGAEFLTGFTVDPADFTCADADGDGDNDLIVHVAATPTSSRPFSVIWWNDGAGFFGTRLQTNRVLEVADLSGDGVPDLVVGIGQVVGGDPDTFAYQVATSPGEFGSAFPFSTYGAVESRVDRVAVFDADSDGDMDVVHGPHDSNFAGSLTLWQNDTQVPGPISFSRVTLEPGVDSFAEKVRVLAADVNGDGFEDLVAGPLYLSTGASAVLLRDPSGVGFLPAELHCILPEALDDRDGDGDADVIGMFMAENLSIDGSAGRRQYGEGIPGTGGASLVLGASGSCRAGEACTLHVRGGRGGMRVFVTLGVAESMIVDDPAPGLVAYNHPWFRRLNWAMSGAPDAPAEGSLDYEFTVSPSLAGVTFYLQAWTLDPAGPSGLVHSGGLELSFE